MTLPWYLKFFTASPWLQTATWGGDEVGPHLAIIRGGHVPLAHSVAVIGIGVVCVSNPFLERNCL